MNNHKTFDEVEFGIKYRVLKYSNDDSKDHIFVEKFINKNKYSKIIQSNFKILIPDINTYHEYYNPGITISKTTYYENGIVTFEYDDTNYEEKILKRNRKEKLKKLTLISS